jgi:hypothetical protein
MRQNVSQQGVSDQILISTSPARISTTPRVFAIGQMKAGKGGKGGVPGSLLEIPRLRRLSTLWPARLQKTLARLDRMVRVQAEKAA